MDNPPADTATIILPLLLSAGVRALLQGFQKLRVKLDW